MGKFAAQVTEMAKIAQALAGVMQQARAYDASVTNEIKAFLAKVEKKDAKLAAIVKEAADRAMYLKKLDDKEYPSYLKMLADAKTAKNDKEIKRCEGLVAEGERRADGILEDGKKLLLRWNASAAKHKAAVDAVKTAVKTDIGD